MIIFHSDLDNTLIYSYRHDIGSEKRCVEYYQGREISYMTNDSCGLLKKAAGAFLFVPVTTRTIEQYQRIALGVGVPAYALVCNGGVLLKDGVREEAWYEESRRLVQPCREEMKKGIRLLEEDENRSFEVRWIEELFVYTKSSSPQATTQRLREGLDTEKADVLTNGEKIYIVPKHLDKGTAVRRFRERMKPTLSIGAGDSLFDVPMLRAVDVPILPEALSREADVPRAIVIKADKLYAEGMLRYLDERWINVDIPCN